MPFACLAAHGRHGHPYTATGKSTFLKILANKWLDAILVQEPIARWTKVSSTDAPALLTCSQQHGGNLLDLFYKDPKRWAYTFQVGRPWARGPSPAD